MHVPSLLLISSFISSNALKYLSTISLSDECSRDNECLLKFLQKAGVLKWIIALCIVLMRSSARSLLHVGSVSRDDVLSILVKSQHSESLRKCTIKSMVKLR